MRIVTRADMDGIVCAVLLSEVINVESVIFVEPQVFINGGVALGANDVVANLPYDPRCGMWFDHHVSNEPEEGVTFEGRFEVVDSAARAVFDHDKAPSLDRFTELLEATDRVDAAKLTLDDVTDPQGYILVAMTVDPRSGLDNTDEYFRALVEWLRDDTLEELLARPEVAERCERILAEKDLYEAFLRDHSRLDGRCVITDSRGMTPPVGSRFLVFTLFPEANVAMRIFDAYDVSGTVGVGLGHSIFNQTCDVNVGKLLRTYGGGGHHGAGSSRIAPGEVDRVVAEILDILR